MEFGADRKGSCPLGSRVCSTLLPGNTRLLLRDEEIDDHLDDGLLVVIPRIILVGNPQLTGLEVELDVDPLRARLPEESSHEDAVRAPNLREILSDG
ncbi:MAG: hypothetical protein JWN12_292 [Candidatus Saccharibacteria bacterium]|nr:hypothetical protein [Candidatus Saccharibacteria bacterium]